MIYWLQLTSGRGPDECSWVVARLLSHILESVTLGSIRTKILEAIPGNKRDTLKSALVALEGEDIQMFSNEWEGTVQWIGQSMFRPGHKRKNWFVGVHFLKPPQTYDYKSGELKVETMRSSGPGGQHANKTESAVRVTHVPSGISATAQEERSQHLNKKLAMTRVHALLEQKESEEKQQVVQSRWEFHNDLERGNPVKVFKGKTFKEKGNRTK